jgi:DtxR family Mn-dependent transcriptional regulator
VEGAREDGVLLADVEPGATVRVLRFENEAEELLHYLKQSGLHPGLDGTLASSDDKEVVVSSSEGAHHVSRSVAETVSVRADPAPAPRAPLPEALVLSSDRYGR